MANKEQCDHSWKSHHVEYRETWPQDKKWKWETCKKCNKWRNIGPE